LSTLENDDYRTIILDRFQEKWGLQSPFLHWEALPLSLVQQALVCIPAAHLTLFFQRILSNISENRNGLPDLIRFWPDQQRYELIEIKGPGDKLQDNQTRWLRYCADHDMPAYVCHVTWHDEHL